MEHRCPVCNKIVGVPVRKEPGGRTFLPFCSRRCKLVDLSAWLDAEYRIVSGPRTEESIEPENTAEPPADSL